MLQKQQLDILLAAPLFRGLSEKDVRTLLGCLDSAPRAYKKGSSVLRAGEPARGLGLVLSGSVNVIREDWWGRRAIVAAIGPGRIFGESYAFAPDAKLGVSVIAAQNAEVLFLDPKKALATCSNACAFHARLVSNLVAVLAAKNRLLNEKLAILARPTTREKVLAYLSAESRRAASATFEIPFDRQELADFLSVDRSALSTVLAALKRDHVLSFEKNRFTLLKRGN